jgi:hypothetical protein
MIKRGLGLPRREQQLRSAKHEDDINDLVLGRPEYATKGLFYVMGLPDPAANDGVERVVAEVEAFLAEARTNVSQSAAFASQYARLAGLDERSSAEQVPSHGAQHTRNRDTTGMEHARCKRTRYIRKTLGRLW